jgi:hypothetical protein
VWPKRLRTLPKRAGSSWYWISFGINISVIVITCRSNYQLSRILDPDSGSYEERIFWDIMPCSPLKVNRVSEEYIVSIFRAEEWAEQATSMKAGGKQNYQLFGTDPGPIGIRQAKGSPAEGHTTQDPPWFSCTAYLSTTKLPSNYPPTYIFKHDPLFHLSFSR